MHAIRKRVKSTLHPPTCSKVQISTSNFKTGQLWSSNSRKSSTFILLGGFCVWTVTFDIFGSAKILYYFFEHLNVLKWKNSKLQSCRSHRGLQFTYKNYLHPTSYWSVFYFLKFESHHVRKYGAEILYYFFEHLTVLKWKNSKLQSCRSHRGLQFIYKNYLHPTSYWRVFYFLKFESHHATKLFHVWWDSNLKKIGNPDWSKFCKIF
jgi:hypothetical protein